MSLSVPSTLGQRGPLAVTGVGCRPGGLSSCPGRPAPASPTIARDVNRHDGTDLHIDLHTLDDVVRVAAAYLQCRWDLGGSSAIGHPACGRCDLKRSLSTGKKPGGPGRGQPPAIEGEYERGKTLHDRTRRSIWAGHSAGRTAPGTRGPGRWCALDRPRRP